MSFSSPITCGPGATKSAFWYRFLSSLSANKTAITSQFTKENKSQSRSKVHTIETLCDYTHLGFKLKEFYEALEAFN